MSLDPLLEPARSKCVVDDVAVGLDNIGIDPRGVAGDLRPLPIGETDEADLAFGLEPVEELDGLSDWKASKVTRYAPRIDPDVVQPYRNVVDDTYRSSGLQKWVEAHDTGVAFFSPLKHGLLTGQHERPPDFGEGDHRSGIPEFQNPEALAHFRHCRAELQNRFAAQPEPVLHALVGALLSDTPTGCALVGLRRPEHAVAAAAVGEPLSGEDARWVRDLYRKNW